MANNKYRSISVIVPAYKQERTIVKNLLQLQDTLNTLRYKYELIVVIDGQEDKTLEKIKTLKSRKIKTIVFKKNYGKGHAVKHGGLRATGDIIGFIDAGFDIDLNGISMLLNHFIWYNADIIVGSKLHPVSKVNYPFYRKILSWGYRTFTRILFDFKVRDTQAGIKLFRKKVVKDVFPRLLVKSFAFDVEILALSSALGYKRIYEAPIKLNFRGASSITSSNLWKTISFMMWDTLAIFYRLKIRNYYKKSNKKNWLK